MPKRRRLVPSAAPLESTNFRRTAAVGDELDRLAAAANIAFQAAGKHGLTRLELARAIDTGRNGAKATIETMRKGKRLYISAWRRGTPAYALGDLVDTPRPVPPELPAERFKQIDILAVAKQEVAAAHAQWVATWVPHRDPAAAWIGGTV